MPQGTKKYVCNICENPGVPTKLDNHNVKRQHTRVQKNVSRIRLGFRAR